MIKKINSDEPIVVGVLGGGQLAKMLSFDIYRLGMQVAIIENGDKSPAGDMTKLEFAKGWHNREELDKFIDVSDIVTLENEFIAPEILDYIAQSKPVFPSADTMKLIQDKLIQKTVLSNKGIPVPIFAEINSIDDAVSFANANGFPFLLKTRTLGYDGYGNHTVKTIDDIFIAFEKFTVDGKLRSLLAEKFVNFTKELAVMVARNRAGEVAIYPCVETIQENHICSMVIAPAAIDKEIAKKAQDIAKRCVEIINGVGVFGIEMFLESDGNVLFNEIAPRPHNSGHYTIEACYTSQYENAIRAILDLPLGETEMRMPAACMLNLLGKRDGSGVPANVISTLSKGNTSLHLYCKKQSRKGRKMGHITALGNSTEQAIERANAAANSFEW